MYIRSRLWSELNSIRIPHTPLMENIIVAGGSGGGVLAFLATHHLTPSPLALLIYYAGPSTHNPFFTSSRVHVYGGGTGEPMHESQISHFLTEPVTTGHTSPHDAFDIGCLSEDYSENKDWVRPDEVQTGLPRVALFPWFLQTNRYPELLGDVDRGLEDERWKAYPKTVLIHGDKDVDAPYQGSLDAKSVIGMFFGGREEDRR